MTLVFLTITTIQLNPTYNRNIVYVEQLGQKVSNSNELLNNNKMSHLQIQTLRALSHKNQVLQLMIPKTVKLNQNRKTEEGRFLISNFLYSVPKIPTSSTSAL